MNCLLAVCIQQTFSSV